MQEILVVNTTARSASITEQLPQRCQVQVVPSYDAAEAELQEQVFELIIIVAPARNEACQVFCSYLTECYFPTRVLVLLDTATPSDLVQLLESGADECIGTNSFCGLLKIKLRQLLQMQKLKSHDLLTAGKIALSPQSGELWINGTKKNLRRREAQILQCLLQYKNRVVTRTTILDHVWTGEAEIPADVTIDVYIRRIRMVLQECQTMLTTVRGFGYRLSEPSA